LGRVPTNEEVYLAHWRGLGGAKKILRNMNNGTASAEEIDKYNQAAHNLNQRVKGGIAHRPHSVVELPPKPTVATKAPTTDGGSNNQQDDTPLKNKHVAARFRDCMAEQEKAKNPQPDDCQQPSISDNATTSNPTTEVKAPISHRTITPTQTSGRTGSYTGGVVPTRAPISRANPNGKIVEAVTPPSTIPSRSNPNPKGKK
jgi:hypothetical protein